MELPLDITPEEDTRCESCKEGKEIIMTTQNWTMEELDLAIEIGKKYKVSSQEQEYFYSVYNRVLGTNRRPGCGKCFANAIKQLNQRYNELLT